MEIVGVVLCLLSVALSGYVYHDIGLEETKRNIQRRYILMRIAFAIYAIGFFVVMGTLSFKNTPFPFHGFTTMLIVGLAITYGQYSSKEKLLEWRAGVTPRS